ncbi:MAG: S-methyl-5-thioribose-1-phosphate isomerase [Lentisphaerae bacterium GWF2_52_8]|nr:MAG: S-methyl-5-thioribose-1-phosphate isomerase [Lentisphaerae bacterium GWF2_52_8]
MSDSWKENVRLLPGKLRIIDQTLLPENLSYLELDNLDEIISAIRRLSVRGAPAIGCAAALGLAACGQHLADGSAQAFLASVSELARRLAESRPTAVNLFWALRRCEEELKNAASNISAVPKLKEVLLHTALDILEEDIRLCRAIGKHGRPLLRDGIGVLTHCNAGALATADYGTALAPIYTAYEEGVKLTVYSDETRPLLQGARLTAWELKHAGVDVVSICDNMAAQVMREGKVQIVIVGADRIAANGDAANKIGTYGVAILAQYHKIPFYVAAPYSTIDISLPDGSGIPIEQRAPEEVSCGFGRRTAPEGVRIYNPAFDVTPHNLISGIITDRGIIEAPFTQKIATLISGSKKERREVQ